MTDSANLPPQKIKAVAALLTAPTVAAAAESVGVSERTLYRWLKDSAFRQALVSAEAEAIGHAARLMAGHVSAAVLALAGILESDHTSAKERIAAARALLSALPNVRLVGSIETQLEELRQNDHFKPGFPKT